MGEQYISLPLPNTASEPTCDSRASRLVTVIKRYEASGELTEMNTLSALSAVTLPFILRLGSSFSAAPAALTASELLMDLAVIMHSLLP